MLLITFNYLRGPSSAVSDSAVTPDSCLLIEMFMEFRKLGCFSIHFISTSFTCLFNFNLFCLDNF
jgi:hypothetical protein